MEKRPIIFFILVLVLAMAVTQFIAYQQYQISRDREHETLLHELSNVNENFRSILYNDITAANTLAIMCKEYGVPRSFDSVASQILKNSKYVDAIQLTDHGIITNIYPLHGHENAIGINAVDDSLRKKEANRVLQKTGIYFAGPRKLKEGGIAILGKMPIIVDNEIKGFSVVITKLSTIANALDIEGSGKNNFAIELSKTNPKTDSTNYLLTNAKPGTKNELASIAVPEGDWQLNVSYSENYHTSRFPDELSVFGFFISIIVGLFAYRIAREPYKLKKIIESKTEQLAASEKYFRTLIESSTDAIVLLDGKGNVMYQTPSAEKISGYTLQEIQSLEGIALIHPDDRADDNEDFAGLVKNAGAVMHNKHRLKQKNGQYIWIEGTYHNLLHDEHVKAIVLNYRDISDIDNERSKRIKIEERLQATMDNMPIGCKTIGFDWKYKYINNEAAAQAFMKKEDFLGNTMYEVYPGVESTNIYAMYKKCMEERVRLGFEEQYTYVNGVTCWYDFKIEPVEEGIFIMTIDITEKRKAFEDITQARHLLGERVKELTTIYELHKILQDEEQSVDEVFSRIVALLPPGWQYPEICEARIVFDGQAFTTPGYKPTDYKQITKIETQDGRQGFIEVIYTTETKPEVEGPFLKEERDLIDTIAGVIEVYFNKKLNQDALTNSEARFRGAFEHAAIGMTLVSLRGERLQVNKELCDMLGYTERELLSLTFQQTIHPDDLEKDREHLRQLLAGTKDYYRVERRYIHKNGSIVWVNLNTAVIKDSNSQPQYFVAQIENITEKKTAFSELEKSEANLRSVFDTTSISYLLMDTAFNIVSVNNFFVKDYEENTGYVLKQGANLFDLMLPDKREQAKRLYESVINNPVTIEYESVYIVKEAKKYFSVTVSPVVSNETVIGLCSASYEITDRKNAFLELQRSEANLRSVFDNSEIMYLLLDTGYNIVAFNKQMQDVYLHLTGHSIHPGDNLINFLVADKRESVKQVYDDVAAGNKSIVYETAYALANGIKYFMAHVVPISLEGVVNGICISSIDITKMKELEFDRQKMITDLLQRNKDLQEFAQIVSHNLRGPLATILGLSNMIADDISEEDKNFILNGIGQSAEKLDSVVIALNSILNVKGDSSESRVTVHLDELIEEIKEKFSNLILSGKAEIKCDFNAVGAIFTTRSFIYSVFYNLLSNSLKYRHKNEPPEINIWTEKNIKGVLIAIKDNGLGIDLDKYGDQIFGLNKRFHNTPDGKGLGLFMVKAQVEALNGTIEVKSKPGVGTTIKIILPV